MRCVAAKWGTGSEDENSENTWIKNTQAKENRLRKWNEQTKHKIACLTERQF